MTTTDSTRIFLLGKANTFFLAFMYLFIKFTVKAYLHKLAEVESSFLNNLMWLPVDVGFIIIAYTIGIDPIGMLGWKSNFVVFWFVVVSFMTLVIGFNYGCFLRKMKAKAPEIKEHGLDAGTIWYCILMLTLSYSIIGLQVAFIFSELTKN